MKMVLLKRKWQLFKRSVRDHIRGFIQTYVNGRETVEDSSIVNLKEQFGVASNLYNQLFTNINVNDNDAVIVSSIRNLLDTCRVVSLSIISSYLLSDQDRSCVNGILSVSTSMMDDIDNIMMKRGISLNVNDPNESIRIVQYTVNRTNRLLR